MRKLKCFHICLAYFFLEFINYLIDFGRLWMIMIDICKRLFYTMGG